MPPWRTTLEMRAASMPDSRATIASASSEVCRCWVSKSAGTYSASITGVIGNTFSRRTEPFQVLDSVAAVAIAGFARSVSARSSGTRMELNICASQFSNNPTSMDGRRRGYASVLVVETLLQQFRAEKLHEPSAAECHIGPIIDRKAEYGEARGRKIFGERLASSGIAAAGERKRQFMHSRIVPDDHQPLRIGCGGVVDGLQEPRRIGAIELRQDLYLRLRNQMLHRLPDDFPGLKRPDRGRNQHGVRERRVTADPAANLGSIAPATVVEPAVPVAAAGCVMFGLGVTQQQKTGKGAIRFL